MTDPQDWHQRVVGALGAVVAVALVIGGVAGAVAYGAVRVAGLGGGEPAAQSRPAASPSTGEGSQGATAPEPTPSPSPSPGSDHTRKPHRAERPKHSRHRLTLTADPRRVRQMQRVHLRGRYPGGGGNRLLVQRLEGGRWRPFPVGVTVRDGSFRTWVASGHPGRNRFRVVDPATGRTSPPVTVTVG